MNEGRKEEPPGFGSLMLCKKGMGHFVLRKINELKTAGKMEPSSMASAGNSVGR